jgi:hypothetical protein
VLAASAHGDAITSRRPMNQSPVEEEAAPTD